MHAHQDVRRRPVASSNGVMHIVLAVLIGLRSDEECADDTNPRLFLLLYSNQIVFWVPVNQFVIWVNSGESWFFVYLHLDCGVVYAEPVFCQVQPFQVLLCSAKHADIDYIIEGHGGLIA